MKYITKLSKVSYNLTSELRSGIVYFDNHMRKEALFFLSISA